MHKLVNMLDINNDKTDRDEKYVLEMQKNFSRLKNYVFGYPENVLCGDIIAYIDLNFKKLSIPGLVVDIIYDEHLDGQSVRTLLLYSNYKKKCWKINPKKVYVFISLKTGGSNSELYLNDDVKKYLDSTITENKYSPYE